MSTTSKSSDSDLIYRHEFIITRGSQRPYGVQVLTNTRVGKRTVKVPADLTGGQVRLAVTDNATGEIVFEKTSLTPSQILIRTPQIDGDLGVVDIFFIPSDTEGMDPTRCYSIEVWVTLSNGDRDTVIDCSPFRVIERKVPMDAPVTPPAVADPSPQTPQERSFIHTWSTLGDSDVVTIPLSELMRDITYVTILTLGDLPALGLGAVLRVSASSKTTSAFTIEASGDLMAGTTINVFLRDIA